VDISTQVTRDPRICGGAPVFVGTRVPLRTVLASLADGDNETEILKSFPTLTREHLQAAVAFAAGAEFDDI
jgi:uncharacterized protein (DUF433 family)